MYLDFVEIGTCDFDTLIEKADNVTFGISIEPIQLFLNKLPDKPNVQKINCLISNCEGIDDIYTVRPELYSKLPEWVRGSNSISHPHPIVTRWLKQNQLPLDIFTKYTVRKTTLYTILTENNICSIDFLKIDAEGHDEIILEKFISDIKLHNNYKLLPKKIQFESNELHTEENILEIIQLLESLGYTLVSKGFDVVMCLQ